MGRYTNLRTFTFTFARRTYALRNHSHFRSFIPILMLLFAFSCTTLLCSGEPASSPVAGCAITTQLWSWLPVVICHHHLLQHLHRLRLVVVAGTAPQRYKSDDVYENFLQGVAGKNTTALMHCTKHFSISINNSQQGDKYYISCNIIYICDYCLDCITGTYTHNQCVYN